MTLAVEVLVVVVAAAAAVAAAVVVGAAIPATVFAAVMEVPAAFGEALL